MAKQLTMDGGEEAPTDDIQPVPKRRRKVAKAKAKPGKKTLQKPVQAGQWQINWVVRNARKLMTVGPDADVWGAEHLELSSFEGAIIRAIPPAGLSADKAAELERELLAAGAAAVKVLPPELSDYQPAAKVEQAEAKPHRQVVLEMAGDDLALRGLLDEVMTEGGL